MGLDPANVATLLAEFPDSASPFVDSELYQLIPFKYGMVVLIEKKFVQVVVVLVQVIIFVGPFTEFQAFVFAALVIVVAIAFVIVISAAPALGPSMMKKEASNP